MDAEEAGALKKTLDAGKDRIDEAQAQGQAEVRDRGAAASTSTTTAAARRREGVELGEHVARREHAKVHAVVRRLFEEYAGHPERIPDGGGAPGADLPQRVTDWLAGMTDRYCLREYTALTVPRGFDA